MSKRTDSSGLGSLGSAALTATSLLVVSGFAAAVGVLIAREFGRTDETDGFFAAYGVFVVVVTASQAIRVAVLPSLARAQEQPMRCHLGLAGIVAQGREEQLAQSHGLRRIPAQGSHRGERPA